MAQKGDRKYNAQVISAGIILIVAESIVIGATLNPAAGLAAAGAGIIGAVALGIAAKDAPHVWGNAKEHEADGKTPPAAGNGG